MVRQICPCPTRPYGAVHSHLFSVNWSIDRLGRRLNLKSALRLFDGPERRDKRYYEYKCQDIQTSSDS